MCRSCFNDGPANGGRYYPARRTSAPVDDAEPLQQLLLKNPAARVDWRGCEYAHTAIVQLLLVAKPELSGPPGTAFLQDWIGPILSRSEP